MNKGSQTEFQCIVGLIFFAIGTFCVVTGYQYVKKAYEVMGRQYSSEQVNFKDVYTSDRSEVQAVLNKYPEHSVTKVYYNPRAHGESVLIKGLHGRDFFPVIFGLIFFSVPLFMLMNNRTKTTVSIPNDPGKKKLAA